MKSTRGRLLAGVLLGVAVLIGMGLYGDGRKLAASLAGFRWSLLVPVLGLTLLNYALRFLKWHYFLRVVGARPALSDSALVFLSGLGMAVTPGKLGELLKAVLLRDRAGVPAAKTASVVLTERLTDFIALVLLASVGVVSTGHGVIVLGIAAAGSIAVVVVASSEPLAHWAIGLIARLPKIGLAVAPKLEALYRSIATLVRPGPLAATTVLSCAAWFCECVGYDLVLSGLTDGAPSLGTATFIYAFATIFGAVTLLPGGLGTTEGSLIGLAQAFGVATTRAASTAAAMLIRFCTLWFAVVVGLIAWVVLRRLPPRPHSA